MNHSDTVVPQIQEALFRAALLVEAEIENEELTPFDLVNYIDDIIQAVVVEPLTFLSAHANIKPDIIAESESYAFTGLMFQHYYRSWNHLKPPVTESISRSELESLRAAAGAAGGTQSTDTKLPSGGYA